MSENNKAIVEKVYDAFGKRDYESVLAFLGQGIEWIAADNSPLGDRSPYHGIDEVREGVFARIAADFSRLTVEIDETIDAVDKIIVLGYYAGNLPHPAILSVPSLPTYGLFRKER